MPDLTGQEGRAERRGHVGLMGAVDSRRRSLGSGTVGGGGKRDGDEGGVRERDGDEGGVRGYGWERTGRGRGGGGSGGAGDGKEEVAAAVARRLGGGRRGAMWEEGFDLGLGMRGVSLFLFCFFFL